MMTSTEPLPAEILKRKAIVYVRQSSQSQVMNNLESKRRQYDLVDVARQRGFHDVEVIASVGRTQVRRSISDTAANLLRIRLISPFQFAG